MRLSGPNLHAQEKNGPSSMDRSSAGRLIYHCHVCFKKWVSRSIFLLRNNRWQGLVAMKICFNCNTEVYPVKRESIGKKSGNQHPVSLIQSNQSLSEVLINTCANDNKRAIFGWDVVNNMPVLFDTGAEISVITSEHCNFSSNLLPSKLNNLKGVTGQKINALGMCTFPLDIGFSKSFCQNFVVVDLCLPYAILGLDFMEANGIILDPKQESAYLLNLGDRIKLSTFSQITADYNYLDCDENTSSLFSYLSLNKISVNSSDKSKCEKQAEEKIYSMLKSYPELTIEPDYNKPAKHSFKLDIDLIDRTPILQKARKFTSSENTIIKEHMDNLVKRGALKEGSSGYVSPIVLVPKKSGKTRVCMDYTRLNAQTMPLNYPIPLIRDLSSRLKRNHRYYSVLDLKEAYYSLPLTKRASERAAIITNQGVYKPLRTMFGLRNAPARFCELIATIIRGMEGYVFYYLDDFIVFSTTINEHLMHVKSLFERLSEYGMVIQLEKCHFCERKVNYLGYQISEKGFLPVRDNVIAIQEMTRPTNLQELRRFLGMINYYHNFIPSIAYILSPLHELTKGKLRPKKRKIDWKNEHQIAFEEAKRALINCAHLTFDDSSKRLILTTDGSGTHCGAVLEVPISNENLNKTQPLAFFSKPFAPTTKTRSTFNRELTAIYLSIRHFKNYLRGRSFLIKTDHKALVNAINNGNGEHSLHEHSMISYIKEYGPGIEHINGNDNSVADTLSRPNATVINCVEKVHWEIPSLESFALYQNEDPQVLKEIEYVKNSNKFKLVTRQVGQNILYGVVDNENQNFRPIVPNVLQPAIFHNFHSALHQGVQKSIDVIRRHYFWSNMLKDIEKWVRFCPKCQSCKVTKHNRQVLENFPNNPKRLEIVHLDIVGPLRPASEEHAYLLTMRDRNTGFVQMVPLLDKSSSTVTRCFKSNWVAIFGLPEKVVTDNGKEFVSTEFEDTCSSMGITHVKTTSYHPQSNGFIERIHRMVKTALRALDDQDQWINQIPLITLMLNNQVTDINSFTPYQKTFGKTGRIPGVIITNDRDDLVENKDIDIFCELMSHHNRYARALNSKGCHMDKNLSKAKYIWLRIEGLRPSLSPIYEGPYLVLQRNSKYFTILCWEGERKVSVDRIKVAYVYDEDGEANEHEHSFLQEREEFDISDNHNSLRRSERNRKKPDRLGF